MTKEQLEIELKNYSDKLNTLQKDAFRVEGILMYLQDKIRNLSNSDLTIS
jgi:hypothetical protein